jgi:hypothetical protein
MKSDLQEKLKEIGNAAELDVRICRRAEIGTVLQQGDVYLHRVPDDHPHGKELGSRQVAVGEGIGSKHMAIGNRVSVFAGVELPSGVSTDFKSEMLGPLVISPKPWQLVHPVHPAHEVCEGAWQVTYQIDLKTRTRVLD